MALKRSHTVFRSPMFKIILKTKSPVQAEATFTPASTPDPDPSSLTSSSDGDDLEEIYYVHNDVLSTSAPKFHAHACNNIPDGFKNSLHLTEVEAETLQLFLKWVYEGDYRPSNYVTGEAHLLSDAKLYIFADRFDIQDLGELVMNRIASRLTPRPANLKVMPIEAMVRGAFGEDLIEEVFDVMVCAFGELPSAVRGKRLAQSSNFTNSDQEKGKSKGKSADGDINDIDEDKTKKQSESWGTEKDPLLEYLAQFASWALPDLRSHERFGELVEIPQLSRAILMAVTPSLVRPLWPKNGAGKDGKTPASTSTEVGNKEAPLKNSPSPAVTQNTAPFSSTFGQSSTPTTTFDPGSIRGIFGGLSYTPVTKNTTTTSIGTGTGLFGGTTTSISSPPPATSPSLFGSASPQASTGRSSSTYPAPNLFASAPVGGSVSGSGGLFGKPPASSSSSTASTAGGGLFGGVVLSTPAPSTAAPARPLCDLHEDSDASKPTTSNW